MGGFALSRMGIALSDGLLAQRKLNGDTGVDGPDNPEELKTLVTLGKKMETALRRDKNGQQFIDQAYRRAKVRREG